MKLFNFRLVEITNPSMYVCANCIVSYAKFMDRPARSTDSCAIHGFLRNVWIHRLRSAIHGLSRSTDWAQHIYIHVSCLDVVQVKLSAIKSIVNKLPCPKCHAGFLKVPVAMLQTYSMLALMTSIHDIYFMHTCVCMLCFNYGLCNICFLNK